MNRRAVTVNQLPITVPIGVCLHCSHCDESFSACRGDYFWQPPTQAFRCSRCGQLLQLVRRYLRTEPFYPSTRRHV